MSKVQTPIVELSPDSLNHHPRVFLELGPQGEAMCPYCGTRYRLKSGQAAKGSH